MRSARANEDPRRSSMPRLARRDAAGDAMTVVARAGAPGSPAPLAAGYGFTCRASLLYAVEERAGQLGCSVDWLFAEALRRMLEEPLPEAEAEAPRRVRTTAPLPPPALPLQRVRAREPQRQAAPPPPRPSAIGRLQLRVQTSEGTLCTAVSSGMVIGRSESESNMVLVHPGVSRKHARIERREHGWVVVDLASFNGVYVNAERSRCSPIAPGDVVGIGPFSISVERG